MPGSASGSQPQSSALIITNGGSRTSFEAWKYDQNNHLSQSTLWQLNSLGRDIVATTATGNIRLKIFYADQHVSSGYRPTRLGFKEAIDGWILSHHGHPSAIWLDGTFVGTADAAASILSKKIDDMPIVGTVSSYSANQAPPARLSLQARLSCPVRNKPAGTNTAMHLFWTGQTGEGPWRQYTYYPSTGNVATIENLS